MSVILAQTDTTVGFLSQSKDKLYEIKERKPSKPFIKVYASFFDAKKDNIRVPNNAKKFLRRSKQTTFIVKDKAFRVATYKANSQILRDLTWSYSTSANKSRERFNYEFCEDKADIIVKNIDGLSEKESSSLIHLGHTKRKKLR